MGDGGWGMDGRGRGRARSGSKAKAGTRSLAPLPLAAAGTTPRVARCQGLPIASVPAFACPKRPRCLPAEPSTPYPHRRAPSAPPPVRPTVSLPPWVRLHPRLPRIQSRRAAPRQKTTSTVSASPSCAGWRRGPRPSACGRCRRRWRRSSGCGMADRLPDLFAILPLLAAHEVKLIVVDGVRAVLYGAPVATFDLDVVHPRAAVNLVRLLAALERFGAVYRGRGGPRLAPTREGVTGPRSHLLMTVAGGLDLLGTIGARPFAELAGHPKAPRGGG